MNSYQNSGNAPDEYSLMRQPALQAPEKRPSSKAPFIAAALVATLLAAASYSESLTPETDEAIKHAASSLSFAPNP